MCVRTIYHVVCACNYVDGIEDTNSFSHELWFTRVNCSHILTLHAHWLVFTSWFSFGSHRCCCCCFLLLVIWNFSCFSIWILNYFAYFRLLIHFVELKPHKHTLIIKDCWYNKTEARVQHNVFDLHSALILIEVMAKPKYEMEWEMIVEYCEKQEKKILSSARRECESKARLL